MIKKLIGGYVDGDGVEYGEIVSLKTTDAISFEFHFDNGEMIIDHCEGIALEDALSIYPRWAMDAMKKASLKQ